MRLLRNNKEVPLRNVIKEGSMIDTSALRGKIGDKRIKILSILTNTAICMPERGDGRKFVESLELVMVAKDDIKYLPIKETKIPARRAAPVEEEVSVDEEE